MTALLDGVAIESPLAQSRGLHYGDGVFRTLLIHQRRPHDLDLHLEHLERDARRLAIVPPGRALLAAEAHDLAGATGRGVLKIVLARRAGGRGYRSADDDASRLLLTYPAPEHAAATREQGIRAFVSPVRLGHQPRLAGAKHLNRLEQVLASRDWPEGADEGLLMDLDGHLVGGTRSNLFWVDAVGRVWTPVLDRCGVEGVTRRKIMDLANQLHVKIETVAAPLSALQGAAEAFVCNSVVGIWPLRSLPGHEMAAPGPLTRRLMQALQHPRG